MKKKVLIGILLLIELCSIYLMYKSSNNKEVLDNKEIKEEKKEKFAIMIENNRGEYKESTDSTFPGTGYYLNTSMSECLDIEGNKMENALTFSNGSVTLTNKYTSYCTLYFDLMSLGKFCDGQTNMGACMSNKKANIGEVNGIASTETGGMYRYQGTDNYICFGTTDKNECIQDKTSVWTDGIQKYMYRIIGITSTGELVLIKFDPVIENDDNVILPSSYTPTFYWHNKGNLSASECGTDGSKCTWEDSILFQRLNGLCNINNPTCKGTTTGMNGDTNIFLGNSFYDYLNDNKWYTMIETHTWKYGDVARKDAETFDGDLVYNIESNFSKNVDAKIGMMYLHDYFYAGSSTPWLYDYRLTGGGLVFFMTREAPGSLTHLFGYRIDYSTKKFSINMPIDGPSYVRPVFYLDPSVKINNASGRRDDPFIITN